MKRSEIRTAAVIAAAYLLIAVTWDVLSDIFVTNLNLGQSALSGTLILKDLIFTLLNALLLFFILRHEFTTLKKNELALRESEDRYRSIYENSLDGILLTAPDGRILAANPAACKILERTEEEICSIGRNVVDAQDPRVQEALARRSEIGYFQSEMNLTRKGGSIFPAEVTSSVFTDKDGNQRTSMIIRDTTQRKQAEAALRDHEARLRLMVEKMPAVLWSTDTNLIYTYSTGAGLANLGLQPNEMIGHKVGETRAERDPASVLTTERHQLVIEKGISTSYDLYWGDLFYHCELEPLRDENGAIAGVIGVALDTTDQVKAFQMLEQRVDERTHEIERRRLVAEGLREIVATINSNQPLETILSFIVSQASHLLQANSVGMFLRKEDDTLRFQAASGWDTDLQKNMVIQIGQGPVGQAVEQRQLITAANEKRSQMAQKPEIGHELAPDFIDEIAIPLIVKGEALGAIRLTYLKPDHYTNEENALALTIADQVRLAIENSHLRGQAEKLAVINERSRLARDLHDSVAQSIYSMTLMAEAARRMQDAGDLEPSRNSLTHLGQTAQQALKEIRLLVYELRPDILEREGLIGALQHRLDAVEGRAGIETRLYCDEPLNLPFRVEEALYWTAQEALNNALKHASASRVQVTIHVRPEIITLEIEDNGQGFDLENLPDRGGMGLTNMRERAKRLNGQFEIQTRVNKGTKVKISFHLNT